MSNRVREYRQRLGLVQAALAVKAGVSPSLVGAVERWDYPPTPTVRGRLAAALGQPVEEIWPPVAEPEAVA